MQHVLNILLENTQSSSGLNKCLDSSGPCIRRPGARLVCTLGYTCVAGWTLMCLQTLKVQKLPKETPLQKVANSASGIWGKSLTLGKDCSIICIQSTGFFLATFIPEFQDRGYSLRAMLVSQSISYWFDYIETVC